MDEQIKRFLKENLSVRITKEYGSYACPDTLYISISLGDEVVSEDYIDTQELINNI